MYHIIVLVASAIGCIGGLLGIFAFLDWRRKRHFLDYIDRRISKSSKSKEVKRD